jgi:hypothetical protein
VREFGTARPCRQGCHELDKINKMPSEQCAEESVRVGGPSCQETRVKLVPELTTIRERAWLVLDSRTQPAKLLESEPRLDR